MPWMEMTPMDERQQFVTDAQSDRFTMAALCTRYGVSRRIGYKWHARYAEEGRQGLADRSRAPHHSPHAIAPAVAELLCALRTAHPHWGARKLLRILRTRHPRIAHWPAASTAADLLARRGLVHKRRTRRPTLHPGVVAPTTAGPNDLWTADFKGQFRTADGRYCYPLTIADQHTRFLLACHGLLSTQTVTPGVRARVPGVRAAARHSDRQRRALRDAGHSRPVVSQRVVDEFGDPAPAHSAGLSAAERRA